jgi:sugar lactone lactonase YvrE
MDPLAPTSLGPDDLGECARWLEAPGELWRVDILRGLVHRTGDPLAEEPTVRTERFEGEVGFCLPRRDGGAVVGVEQELWLVNLDGERRLLLRLEEPTANRFNDAICDQQGRLWAGTFARDRRPAASLYRIDPDGAIERLLTDLTISNGIGWLADGEVMHFIDSPTQRIEGIAVDQSAGRLMDRRPLVEIDASEGSPDGLCVDIEEGTWVAFFGGGTVKRYDPDGNQTAELVAPVPHLTSPCVGGSSGRELFVTTTRHRLEPDELRALPLAGRVFHSEVAVAGRPTLPFAG